MTASLAPRAGSSPNMSRLDRILELVTNHEECYRQQDMRLSEVGQRVAEVEQRMLQELEPLWALKERNIPRELDLARSAVEALVQQVASLARANQLLQGELKASQMKQQQQQQASDFALSVLQADVAALRSRLDDVQDNTAAGLEQLRSSSKLQASEQQLELEQVVQSLQHEASLLRQGLTAQAKEAVSAVEGWTKGELLQLAKKLKDVVSACSNHQQQVNLQMEALQLQWDNTSAAIEALQQEDKRLKKHVSKLSQSSEEVQRLVQQAVSSEVTVQQLRNDIHQLSAAQQQLNTRLEVSVSANSSFVHKLAGAQQQLELLDSRVEAQALDLVRLAEAAGACLAAARAKAMELQAAGPSSLLSTLLAPAVAPTAPATSGASITLGAGLTGGGGLSPLRASTPQAWDDRLSDFEALLGCLRHRLQAGHKHLSSSAGRDNLQAVRMQLAAGSPARQRCSTTKNSFN